MAIAAMAAEAYGSRVRLEPWWVAAAYWTAVVPADFVMARQMLRGIRHRVEAAATAGSGRR